jgi:hypothetical protein
MYLLACLPSLFPRARLERKHRLTRFINAHAIHNLPGPHPFLRSLYAALHIQSLALNRGGAGRKLVTWDVQDEVWTEAGGNDFMTDGVQLIKGVRTRWHVLFSNSCQLTAEKTRCLDSPRQ